MMFFFLFLFGVFVTSAHGHRTSGLQRHSFSRGIKSPQRNLLQANGRAERDYNPEHIPVDYDAFFDKVSEEIDSHLKAFNENKGFNDARGVKNLRKYFLQDNGKPGGKPSWKKTIVPTNTAVPNPRGDTTPFEQEKFAEEIDMDSLMKTMGFSKLIITASVAAMSVIFFIVLVMVIVLCKVCCKCKPRQKSPV